MSNLYFIGGASLSGKAEVAHYFSQKYVPGAAKPLQYVSTDGLRRILWENLEPEDFPALFQLHADRRTELPEDELIASLPHNTNYYVQRQEKQQRVVWEQAAMPYLLSQYDRNLDVLAEGVTIMPHHLANLTQPHRAVFVGNCSSSPSEAYLRNVLAIARHSRDHWMRLWSEAKIRAWITHITPAYSRRIQQLAQLYGYPFFDLSEGYYQEVQRAAARHLFDMSAVVGVKAT